jgi:hypothetical protein
MRLPLVALLLVGCGSTGPSEPIPPGPGVYDVMVTGLYDHGGRWTREFGVQITRSDADSINYVTVDGLFSPGIVRQADWNGGGWHTIFGESNVGNVVLRVFPDLTCEGRWLIALGESWPTTDCTFTARQ